MSTTAYMPNTGIQAIERPHNKGVAHNVANIVRLYAPSVLACLALIGAALLFGAATRIVAVPSDVSTILALYGIKASLPQELAVLPYLAPSAVLAVLAIAAWRGVQNIASYFNTAVTICKPSRAFSIAITFAVFVALVSLIIHIAGVALVQINAYIPTTAEEAEVIGLLNYVAMLVIPTLLLALFGGLIAALKFCAGSIKTATTVLVSALKWSAIFVCGVIVGPIALVLAATVLMGIVSIVLCIALLPFILSLCFAATR